jgi:isocitrate dehydrogenase
LGEPNSAELIHNAWLKTLEEGIHTYDIFKEKISKQKVGTKEFAEAVMARLGKKPETLPTPCYKTNQPIKHTPSFSSSIPLQELKGIDIFIKWDRDVETLAPLLELNSANLKLKMISNRGVRVWPNKIPETSCVDHWRCRFISPTHQIVSQEQIIDLLNDLVRKNLIITQTAYLFAFDKHAGYTLAQDEQ